MPKDPKPLTFVENIYKTKCFLLVKNVLPNDTRKQMAKYLAFDHSDIKFNFEGEPVGINILKFGLKMLQTCYS